LAKIIKDKNIEKVVFDRNWYLYHGRVKAFAEGIRAGWVTL
jgi:large subunit ribosomal protein L18